MIKHQRRLIAHHLPFSSLRTARPKSSRISPFTLMQWKNQIDRSSSSSFFEQLSLPIWRQKVSNSHHALWGRRPHAFSALMLINVCAASIHFFYLTGDPTRPWGRRPRCYCQLFSMENNSSHWGRQRSILSMFVESIQPLRFERELIRLNRFILCHRRHLIGLLATACQSRLLNLCIRLYSKASIQKIRRQGVIKFIALFCRIADNCFLESYISDGGSSCSRSSI